MGEIRCITEMRKGYTRIIILSLLSKKPFHGYEIIKTIEDIFFDWSPSPSAVYPILHSLDEEGYVEKVTSKGEGKERKLYECTLKGRELLKRAVEWQNKFSTTLLSMLRRYASEVLRIDIKKDLSPGNMPFWFDIESAASMKDKPKGERLRLIRDRRDRLEEIGEEISKAIRSINLKISELERQ